MLGLALLAAAVVPNMSTRTVAGTATAVPVPDPPAVGDCLLRPVVPDIENVNGVLTLPAATIGPCDGPHYGEVIEMKPNFPDIPWVEGAPQPGMNDPHILELLNCNTGSAYLGATAVTASDGNVAGWAPALMFQSGLVQPSTRQRAAGQRWAACVILAAGTGTETGLALNYVPRAARLRGAISSGSVPDDFALCSNPPVELQRTIPCTQQHTLQLLGWTDLSTFSTPAARSAACRALAVSLTRMPDPTATASNVRAGRTSCRA